MRTITFGIALPVLLGLLVCSVSFLGQNPAPGVGNGNPLGPMPLPFPDALQEFSVATSALSAQHGMDSGSGTSVGARTRSSSFITAVTFRREPLPGSRKAQGLWYWRRAVTSSRPMVHRRCSM